MDTKELPQAFNIEKGSMSMFQRAWTLVPGGTKDIVSYGPEIKYTVAGPSVASNPSILRSKFTNRYV